MNNQHLAIKGKQCGTKNCKFDQCCNSLGAPIPTPLDWSKSNVACYSRLMVYTYMPDFSYIGIICCPLGESQILPYFEIHYSLLTPPSSVEAKLNVCAQLQIFPCPMVPKPFLYSNAVNASDDEVMHTHFVIQMHDVQKGEKQQFFSPGGSWSPSPTKLGTVIEESVPFLHLWT